MPIELRTPGVDELDEVVRVLARWQVDGDTIPLHPGDVGWHWRFGASATAGALRTWDRDGEILAMGLLDGNVLRCAVAPHALDDEALARQMREDVTRPERGVLAAQDVSIEARGLDRLRGLLTSDGWQLDEAWTPLRRDLRDAVPVHGVRVEVIGPAHADVRTALQRAAFPGSTFTDELWAVMAGASPYADARCLVALDDDDHVVAAVTVWSAGPERPGLLEPMGVHPDHRGRGYGTQICLAAAAALYDLGASSATVCTSSANVGAVATYASAGFLALPESRDLRRVASNA